MKKMKKVSCSVLTLLAAGALCEPVFASTLHTDVALQTYTDFGQNKGRYTINANALLQHIRVRDGGIVIPYTDGTAPWKISNEQGMINFSATDDIGAQAAIAPNFMATVLHNGSINASFAAREIGDAHAINYSAIDIRGSNVFRLAPYNKNGSQYDYMIQRQNKIVTDATWNPLTTITNMNQLKYEHAYHSGAGTMNLWNESTKSKSGLMGAYQYIVGGINLIDNAQTHAGTTNISIHQNPNYGNGVGASPSDPLPNAIQSGDSGSPIFIYNETTKRYEYLAAQQSGGGNSYGQARGNVTWTHETMESFNERPNMAGINEVRLGAISHRGETKTDSAGRTTTIFYGKATDASGKVLAEYDGVQHGQHTWKDLSDIKNLQNWYAYDSSARQQLSDEALFFSENLVFTPTQETNNKIILTDTVDLGVGYVEFNRGELNKAVFHIKSEGNESNLLNSAGYVVNEGTEVHLYQTNPANYMREWRKTGAGDLYIRGSGNSNALLSVGGSGKTYLERENGHAAYNVLASSGATVVIKDIGQIARDFTFGSGGGVLDLNGNSMTWILSNTNVPAAGFSINALTEDAIIANNKGAATLTFTERGAQKFLGSFRDTANSSLKIIYNGGAGSSWTLNGVFTNLQNAASGLEVQSGEVILIGTNTIHGMGSDTGKNKNRYHRSNDWHYADAATDVSVKSGATFRLGAHARLIGDVSVASGGVFVMNEGVKNCYEYIEGGLELESTYAVSDFYGLKGNVTLAQGAEMRVVYNADTTANTTYAGNISGNGNVSVSLGNNIGTFILAGNNRNFNGRLTLNSGELVIGYETAGISGETAIRGGTLQISAETVTLGNVAFRGNGGTVSFNPYSRTGHTVYNADVISTNETDNYTRRLVVGKKVTVNARALANAWGLGSLTVDGVLNLSEKLEFSTGANASLENNRITGSGTIKTPELRFGNIGTYNIDGVRIEVGRGGMRGNGSALNLGDATIAVAENWAAESETFFSLVSNAGTRFETQNASGEATFATLAGRISGSGKLVKTGSGTLTLTANNANFSGQFVVENGTLRMNGAENVLGNQDQTGRWSRYAAVVKTGGMLDVNGTLRGGNNCYKVELAGGALVNNGADIGMVDRQITGLRLSANSEVGGSGNFGLISSAYVGVGLELNGHTLTKTGGNVFSVVNATSTAGTVRIEEGAVEIAERNSNMRRADFVLAGGALRLAQGAGLSVKSVSGTSGTVEVGTGTLSVGGTDANGTFSGNVNFTGTGTISFVGGTHDWTGITHSGSGRYAISGNGTRVKMNPLGNAAVSVGSGAVLEVSAVSSAEVADMSGVSGNGKIALKLRDVNGRGFNLSAFTGTIEVGKAADVSVGRLRLNTSTLNAQSQIRVLSGGELVFDGTGTQISNNVVFEANSKIHANFRKDGTLSGSISAAGGVVLTKAGGGVLTLSGDNSGFLGEIVVISGTLNVTDIRALGTGEIRVNNGAKVQLSVENADGFSGITLAAGAKLVLSENLVESLAGVKTENGEQIFVDSSEFTRTEANDGNVELSADTEILVLFENEARTLTGESEKMPLAGLSLLSATDFSSLKTAETGCLTCVRSASAIPEPSMFGLLAGLGAAALAASRRRRK